MTPFLNEEKNIEKWDVNLESDDRILTVETSDLTEEEVKKAGFKTEVTK